MDPDNTPVGLSKLTGPSVEIEIDLNPIGAVTCTCDHLMGIHAEIEIQEEGEEIKKSHQGKCGTKGCACEAYVKKQAGEKAWMAPLGAVEDVHAESVAREAFKTVSDGGSDLGDSTEASIRCKCYCIVYYTVRTGPAKNSPRMFPSLRATQMIPLPEIFRLVELQGKTFAPTEDELKNFLRARITASGI